VTNVLPITGEFINADGYSLAFLRKERRWLFFKEKIYRFALYPDRPLTYLRKQGDVIVDRIRPNASMETDLSSTPPPLHGIKWLRPDFLPRSSCIHDTGRGLHGLWFSVQPLLESAPYEFRRMTIEQVDDLLLETAQVEAFCFRKLQWDEACAVAVKYHWAVTRFGRRW